MPYFELFPRLAYRTDDKLYGDLQNVTNIFFRVRVLREILQNVSAYYEHTIADGDTPEILAEKLYRDAGAYWIILLANEIIDPQYEWPLDARSFRKYIVKKYGSISNAKTTYHHYEKVITRTESLSGLTTESRFQINQSNVVSTIVTVPYDSYDSLPETQLVETFDMGFTTSNTTNTLVDAGRTVTQITKRNRVSNYDWEMEQNENRRLIKIIKPEYYPAIMDEFRNLSTVARAPFLRRLT